MAGLDELDRLESELAALLHDCKVAENVPPRESHQNATIKLFSSLCSVGTPRRDHDMVNGLSLAATASWLVLYGVAADQASAEALCNGRLDRDVSITKLIETARLVRAARRLDNLDDGCGADSPRRPPPPPAAAAAAGAAACHADADAGDSSRVEGADGGRDETDVWSTIPAMTDLVLQHRREIFATEFPLFPPEVASVLPTLSALDDSSVLIEQTYLAQRTAELDDALAAEADAPTEEAEAHITPGSLPRGAWCGAVRGEEEADCAASPAEAGARTQTQEALTAIRDGTRRLTDALDAFGKMELAAVEVGALPGTAAGIGSERAAERRTPLAVHVEVDEGLGVAASQICERVRALKTLDEQTDQAASLAEQLLCVNAASRDRTPTVALLASLDRALDKTSKKHAVLKRRVMQVNKENVAA